MHCCRDVTKQCMVISQCSSGCSQGPESISRSTCTLPAQHVIGNGHEVGLGSRLRKVPQGPWIGCSANPEHESQGNRKMTDGNREIFLIVALKPKQPEREDKLCRGLHPAK